MRPFVIASLALGLLASPACAGGIETGLSATQVQHQLGGFHCGGSSCSQSSSGSRIESPGAGVAIWLGPTVVQCGRFFAAFDQNCTPLSLVSATAGGGFSIATIVTTTKVLGFDGSTGTFSITTSTSSVDK